MHLSDTGLLLGVRVALVVNHCLALAQNLQLLFPLSDFCRKLCLPASQLCIQPLQSLSLCMPLLPSCLGAAAC